jgi:DNA-binding PucR family transcriptional regulator
LVGDPSARERLLSLAYDPVARAGGSLKETVGMFLACGRSLELASKTMFVHPNTIRYRLKKVTELTGWDALNARDAAVLSTAFALGQLRESGHAPL